MNQIVLDGYYLLHSSHGRMAEYTELFYAKNIDDLKTIIEYEYMASDAAEVCKLSIEELMEGYTYDRSCRQGCGKQSAFIKLFHNENLIELLKIMNRSFFEDEDEITHCFGDILLSCSDEYEIEELVDAYNWSFDNYWS